MAHAVMVLIPEKVNNSDVEETLQTVKSRAKKTFSMHHNIYFVVCGCKEVAKQDRVPSVVLPISGGGDWTVIIVGDIPQEGAKDCSLMVTGRLPAKAATSST